MEDGEIENMVTAMGAAQHRFESARSPLGRSIVWFDALLPTANQMYAERKCTDKVGRSCHAYLHFIDDEGVLQSGMLADATDEHMCLLRPTDTENSQKQKLVTSIENFITRVDHLFNAGGCFKCGYTKVCMKLLGRTRMICIDGVAKSIGGRGRPKLEVKNRCVSRMANWLFLATLTCRAEFPEMDKLLCFQLLNLDEHVVERTWADDVSSEKGRSAKEEKDRMLKHMASICKAPEEALAEEILRFLPVAMKHYRRSGGTMFQAWKTATEECNAKGSHAHKPVFLLEALCRDGGWGDATSGIEQTFTQQMRIAPINRSHATPGLLNDELTLITSDMKDDDEAIRIARRLWATLYGSSRDKARVERCDVGKVCGERNQKSEVKFLRKRREDVTECMRSLAKAEGKTMQSRITTNPLTWSSKLEKEAFFQLTKEQKKVLGALEDGELGAEDVDEHTALLLMDFLQKKKANDKLYYSTRARQALAVSKPDKVALKAKAVFLDLPTGLETSMLGINLRKAGMVLRGDRVGADVIVIDKFDHIGVLNEWYAILSGALLCTAEYIESNGKRGPSLKYWDVYF
jgi:hypothetical protein